MKRSVHLSLFLLVLVLTALVAKAQESATASKEELMEAVADAEEHLDLDEMLREDLAAETIPDKKEEEANEPPTVESEATESKQEKTGTAADNTDASNSNNSTTAETQESTTTSTSEKEEKKEASSQEKSETTPVQQSGPLVDLLGHQLYSLEMIDESQAQLVPHYTNEALKGKKVIGIYFSADWCGPCRQFTPELVQFYNKMNNRRGHKDDFEIVWVSRCRDMQSYGQYFTHMNWLALPPEEAMGQRGQMLSEKYKVKSIPTLVLLDDLGNVITTDARTKIPQDKEGIGFPWRNPLVTLYTTIIPRSLRMMVKTQVGSVKGKLAQRFKSLVGMKSAR